jgi:hypothetical protein
MTDHLVTDYLRDTPHPHPLPLPQETVSQYEKTVFFGKGGEAVEWKRFRAVTFSRWDSDVPEVLKRSILYNRRLPII